MPKNRLYQSNFSSGYLDPYMAGRSDLKSYQQGLSQSDNWYPLAQGGIRRRPGTRFLSSRADDGSKPYGRIFSFEFDEDEKYIMWMHGMEAPTKPALVWIQHWDIYQLPADGTMPPDYYDMPSPCTVVGTFPELTQEQWKLVKYTQRGDTALFHFPDGSVPKKMVRESANVFSLSNFTFDVKKLEGAEVRSRQPFFKFAPAEVTIKVTNGTDYVRGETVTVECTEDYFETDHVGLYLQYRGKQMIIASYISATLVTATLVEELPTGIALNLSSFQSTAGFKVGEIVFGQQSGAQMEVQVSNDRQPAVTGFWHVASLYYIAGLLLSGEFQPGEIVEGIESGSTATVATGSAGIVKTDPPNVNDWEEQAFSDFRGYATTAAFHSQRLWLGGSPSLPAHIFGSKVAAFFNFEAGDGYPADSIQTAISGNQVSKVLSIVSGRHLQVFTDKAELFAPETDDKPLSPEDFSLRTVSKYGIEPGNDAMVFDEATLYIQANGKNIREFIYSDLEAGYSASSVSIAAANLLVAPYRMAVLFGAEDRPEQLALVVSTDGTIAWHQSIRREEVKGWGRWTTNDMDCSVDPGFRDVCIVDEYVFVLARRKTVGVETTYLEVFDWDRTMDCSTSWSGTLGSTLPNYWNRFIGESLPVVTDSGSVLNAYLVGNYTVGGGGGVSISPLQVDNATVGLNYTAIGAPMWAEFSTDTGYSLAEPKRIVQLAVLLDNTLHIEVDGFPVYAKQVTDDFSLPPTPITGMRQWWQLGYDFRRTVIIQNDVPLPCTVLSLSMEVAY